MNTGIGDAVNLSWKLASVLQGRAHQSILDSYEPERIAFARRLVATTDQAFAAVTSNDWFARRGDGYLALKSQRPAHWQAQDGPDQGREWLAPGADNVWICELGSRRRDWSFGRFADRVASAPIRYGRRSVVYESPSQGLLALGWEGPLVRDGRPISLRDFPRYASPWADARFPAEAVEVRAGGETHRLRFATAQRGPA